VNTPPTEILKHEGFIRNTLRQMRYRPADQDDMLQEGYLALLEMCPKHDDAKSKFLTFAWRHLRYRLWRRARQDSSILKLPGTINPTAAPEFKSAFERARQARRFVQIEKYEPGAVPTEYDEPDPRLPALRAAIETLSERERIIVFCRLRSMTFKEIGAQFGVSKQRIEQIWRVILRKLREQMARAEAA
jgi:RNA polymerase sigma factor (sigma-70 family)